MERAIFQNLLEWKHDPDRKPLILKGVRQCGKTWLLKEFGARCYPDTAYFNLEKTAEIRARFH
ncbi:MAG: AAA family ATPase, partial [Acidobacteriota bacterium]|nr:AAA family ATPase [Acidobacteriota bacterium]